MQSHFCLNNRLVLLKLLIFVTELATLFITSCRTQYSKPACVIYTVRKQSSYFALCLLSMVDCLGDYSVVENNLVPTHCTFNLLTPKND